MVMCFHRHRGIALCPLGLLAEPERRMCNSDRDEEHREHAEHVETAAEHEHAAHSMPSHDGCIKETKGVVEDRLRWRLR